MIFCYIKSESRVEFKFIYRNTHDFYGYFKRNRSKLLTRDPCNKIYKKKVTSSLQLVNH